MTTTIQRRSGQALVMVTLALLAMFGIIGLAVDVGWAFYVKRSAQSAADAAALAAALEALRGAGTGAYTCGNANVTCWTTPRPCPASPITDDPADNLDNGCLYAQQNGFTVGGRGSDNGNQLVTMQSNVPAAGCFPNCIPTAPGVHAYYWVTARVSEQIPQLFSAVLGNGFGTSGARATAAIAEVPFRGSLILLNRANDPYGDRNAPNTGTDLYIGGNDTVTVPGGILLASKSTVAGDFGGHGGGQGQVNTPFTYIQGANGHGGLPNYAQSRWQNWYQNQPDGYMFRDPFEGKGQPPLTAQSLNPIPVLGGNLTTAICPNYVCPQGIYFATSVGPTGGAVATGAPITLTATSSQNPWKFGGGTGSSFGEFTFFGGLVAQPNGPGSNVDFGPGRYVLAGVSAPGNSVLDTVNKTTISGGGVNQTTGQLVDAGRLFILTDSTYPGLDQQIRTIDNYLGSVQGSRSWSQLYFGTSNFQSGNNGSSVTLYGLDKGVSHPETNALGYTLQDFGNVVIWQDQRNSNVKYTTVPGYTDPNTGRPNVTNGTYDWSSCGGTHTIENPCLNTIADRHMDLTANQYTHLEGTAYQPRGANVTVWAGTGYIGPITIVSGGLAIQGTGTLTLNGPLQPITRRVATLVE